MRGTIGTGTVRGRSVVGMVLALGWLLVGPGCDCGTAGGPDAGPTCLPLDAGPVGQAWAGYDAGVGGVPLGDLVRLYAQAYCEALSRCTPFDDRIVSNCVERLSAGPWATPVVCSVDRPPLSQCVNEGYDLAFLRNRVLVASSGIGGLAYDPHQAAACLGSPWRQCDGFGNIVPVPACQRLFQPLVVDAGACQLDAECLTGTCTRGNVLTCAGTCAPGNLPPPPVYFVGGRCDDGEGCGTDAGLACDGLNCRRPGPEGADCGVTLQCAAGLVCSPRGTCTPPVPLGGICAHTWNQWINQSGPGQRGYLYRSGPCEPGLVCVGELPLDDGGVRPGTCRHPGRVGDACLASPGDGLLHETGCLLGLVCSCGVCAPAPTEAAACGDGWAPCAPYRWACQRDSGVCLPVSSFASCTNSQQCATGRCDIIETNRCIEPVRAPDCSG